MIRIAHTITRLAGGPPFRVILRSKHMNRDLFDVKVFYGSINKWDPKPHDYLIKDLPFETTSIPEMQRNIDPVKDTIALGKLIKHFWEYKPHIVHTHESKDGILARVAAKIVGVPVIMRTFHGTIYRKNYFGDTPPKMLKMFLNIERAASLISDAIVSPTKQLDYDLVDRFKISSRDQLYTVSDAIDLKKFVEVKRKKWLPKELKIKGNSLIMTVVANFQLPKDHNNILTAFSIFRKRYPKPDPHLVLVGDGPLKQEILDKIKALNIENCVHLMGHRTDIPEIYGSSNIAFLGSSSEGTPACISEALATGTRVVATDVGGMRDVLDDENWGTLVPMRDSEALAEGLKKELRIRRNRAKIKREVYEIHDVRSNGKHIEKLYMALLLKKKVKI
jgi:glycosyltransferase involved in cell wall biosynthesis